MNDKVVKPYIFSSDVLADIITTKVDFNPLLFYILNDFISFL